MNKQPRKNGADAYAVGLDFGTDSVRAVIVDTASGEQVAASVFEFPRWRQGLYCDPVKNQFRQHPLDYIEGLNFVVCEALSRAPRGTGQKVAAIGVDTTGSTPGPLAANGQALALQPEFSEDPDAMFALWKDHTAVAEAEEITRLAKGWVGGDVTRFVGGVYSAEWFWAKILHVLRGSPRVRGHAATWIEHCDWIPALLTGSGTVGGIKRSRCAAGHKAMWHASFGGLPAEAFWTALDPLLTGMRGRLYQDTCTSDQPAGTLSAEWASRLGLSRDVVVGVGAFDAHMGALGGGIEPYILTKVIGTSTCDVLIVPGRDIGDRAVAGICGQVDGSIVPGFIGLEAGQSAFGDVFAWFQQLLLWPWEAEALQGLPPVQASAMRAMRAAVAENLLASLSARAEALPAEASAALANDWLNGRRTPFADQTLTGAVCGLTLATDAPRFFRALVEATAFGARKINDCFIEQGIPIQGIIALGGIPQKSPYIMQVLADVLFMPIHVARSEQSCALGAAMCAATAAGLYPDLQAAQRAMAQGFARTFQPDPAKRDAYRREYDAYSRLGAFIEGRPGREG
jgi:L-ribulokinase